MADRPLSDLLRHLRRTALPSAGVLPDAELLRRFVGHHDEAAFEALVWRHGPLVAGVCRRVLGRTPDAEDAFQAAFLVLARKAGSIRGDTAVGPWLYRVAFRVALRARERAAQADRVQPLPDDLPAPAIPDDAERRDQMRVLDEEVQRLPAKYRETVVLRYLEGLSTAEVADTLKCPPGTVLSRLAWARQRLRSRLSARGVTLSAAVALAAATGREAGAVPVRWVAAVAGAALRFAAGGSSGVSLTRPALLAEGVLRAMFLTKLQVGAMLTLGVLVAGAGLMVPTLMAGRPDDPPADEQPNVVTVSRPTQREMTTYLDFSGWIRAAESVVIRPRVSATLEKVDYRPGADVKRGDLLFELDDRVYRLEVEKAEAELKRADARSRQADAALARTKQLQDTHAVNQSALDAALSAQEEAVAGVRIAQVGLARAKLDLDATRITAPINGRIGRPYKDAGNIVGPTTDMAILVSTDRVYASFNVPAGDLPRLRKALQVTKVALLGLSGEESFPRRGEVDFVDNEVNPVPGPGTVTARAVFPNGDGELLPGMSARIRLSAGEAQQLLLVPQKAVRTTDGRSSVLVVGPNNTVEWRAVTLGPAEGDMRVVREGLKPDDRVILDGLANVRPGAPVQIREADVKK